MAIGCSLIWRVIVLCVTIISRNYLDGEELRWMIGWGTNRGWAIQYSPINLKYFSFVKSFTNSMRTNQLALLSLLVLTGRSQVSIARPWNEAKSTNNLQLAPTSKRWRIVSSHPLTRVDSSRIGVQYRKWTSQWLLPSMDSPWVLINGFCSNSQLNFRRRLRAGTHVWYHLRWGQGAVWTAWDQYWNYSW